jgi:predicted lactoylglutathione lyase
MKLNTYTHLYTENVAVSRDFFTKIGLTIKDDYSNEQGFCVEFNKNSYLMVLEKPHLLSFHPTLNLAPNDVHSSFISLEMKSIEHVDRFMKKVIKHGGIETEKAHEDEWVYYRSFKDIDKHQFEVFYMKQK